MGIVCAAAFFAMVVLPLAFPGAFLFPPYHGAYDRILSALLVSFGIGLLLALRDPQRNAGVYALLGLATGSWTAAIVYALVVEGADPIHWLAQVPLLAAVAIALVVTYTRLRRPHPLVVRIVIAAVLLQPLAMYVYDAAYRASVAR